MKRFIIFGIVAGFASLTSGCSLKSAKELYGDNTLSIKLEKMQKSFHSKFESEFDSSFDLSERLFSAPIFGENSGKFSTGPYMPSIFAPDPASLDDFNCFLVNVSGPGIIKQNLLDPACTFADDMKGQGIGFISEMVEEGVPIDMMVTTGVDRRIDAFAITNGHCGQYGRGPGSPPLPYTVTDHYDGSNAYHIGTKIADITGPLSLTVPVGYNEGTGHSVHCDQHHIVLRHTTANLTAGYTHKADLNNSANSLNGGVMVTGFANEIATDDIAEYDGDVATATGGSGFHPQLVMLFKATGNFDIAKYPNMKVYVDGRAKDFGGAVDCTVDGGNGAGSSFSVFVADTSTNWVSSPIGADPYHVEFEIPTPPLTANGYIAIGIQGPTTNTTCLGIESVIVSLDDGMFQ